MVTYQEIDIHNVICALGIANGEWSDWLDMAHEMFNEGIGAHYTPDDIATALNALLTENPDDARIAGVCAAIGVAFGVPFDDLPGVTWWLEEEGLV